MTELIVSSEDLESMFQVKFSFHRFSCYAPFIPHPVYLIPHLLLQLCKELCTREYAVEQQLASLVSGSIKKKDFRKVLSDLLDEVD